MKTNKWRKLILLFAAAVILAFSGCGDDFFFVGGAIELNNQSDMAIDGFYLAPVDQTSWGPDLLSVLYPDEYVVFGGIHPDDYDVKIRASGEFSDYFSYVYNLSVYEGDYIALNVYNESFTGSLEIRNGASASITGVYVVPADASTWGANQASSDIGPSETFHLTDLDPGLYDIRIVWDSRPDSFYNDRNIESLTLTILNVD